jgi:hypothetical protein
MKKYILWIAILLVCNVAHAQQSWRQLPPGSPPFDHSGFPTGAGNGTDNTIVRWDGTSSLQNSNCISDDDGKIACTATLDNATGDEIAYDFSYTVNKATSGDTYAIYSDMTDTASPGTDYPLWLGAGGSGKFTVDKDGSSYTAGGRKTNVTTVNAATYDLLVTDYILHVTYTATAAVTSVTLPTAQCDGSEDDGRVVIIKDAGGNAGTNNITIDTEGGENIDGSATLVINGNYDSASIYCENSNWFIY